MNLIPTRRGLEVAATLLANGMKIAIETFKVGSAYGYTPDPETDEDIRGTQLHIGTPSNYRVVDRSKLEYTCYMNELVGDFNWGEVGAYIRDNDGELVLFALGCLDRLQPKMKTTTEIRGNVVAEILRIDMNSIEAVIEYHIQELTEAKMLMVDGLYMLRPPQASPSNAYITGETDDFGNNIQAYRKSETEWSFPTHGMRKIAQGVATTLTDLYVLSPQINEEENIPPGKYIIQFLSGNFEGEARVVTTMQDGRIDWAESFAGTGQIGDRFVLMQSTLSYYQEVFENIHELLDNYYTKPEVDSFLGAVNHSISVLDQEKAPLDSPSFIGTPETPSPLPDDDSGRIPTTSWVRAVATSLAQNEISQIPRANRVTPGLALIGKNAGTDGQGRIIVQGMVHPSPEAPNAERNANILLANSFNPNAAPIESGVYSLPIGQSWPGSYFPVNRPGQLHVSRFENQATYIYYPKAYSPTDYEGLRVYHKTWDSSSGWGPWVPSGYENVGNWITLNEGTPAPSSGILVLNTGSWGNGGYYFYINGMHVGTCNTPVDETGTYTVTLPLGKGDVWTYSLFWYSGRGYIDLKRFYSYR